jgi:hypothetical protein
VQCSNAPLTVATAAFLCLQEGALLHQGVPAVAPQGPHASLQEDSMRRDVEKAAVAAAPGMSVRHLEGNL